MSSTVGRIARRARLDLLPTDRIDEYRALLEAAASAGYRLVSVSAFDLLRGAGKLAPDRRYLILRHDVDIPDVRGNEAFHAVERALGAGASYYFRRSTAAPHARLIHRLRADGFEVGFHYEEAAAIAKRTGAGTRQAVLGMASEIRAAFRADVSDFRARWAPDLRSVVSHGDWVNRRLRVFNEEFVTPDLLAETGLALEARQPDLMAAVDVYVSDVATPPARWRGDYGLAEAIRDGRAPIYLLTHERQWASSPVVKLREDLARLGDELRYRARARG